MPYKKNYEPAVGEKATVTTSKTSQKISLQFLAAKWPSEVIVRKNVGTFTNGAMTPKTQANLDSLGQGPPERIRIGRQVAYPVDAYIRWLESRVTACGRP